MSKPIKMTDKYLSECRADFEKALKLTKLADGKLNFTKTFTIENKKATVYFTSEAWSKMVMLIFSFDKEVAWHGVASRVESDENKDEYIISDILVYPQEVTGATVEMDTEKYATWIMDNDGDERFNNIHMQGHSHVNMATNPSSVDLNHQEEILNMLDDGDFYIFMIWNKSFSSNTKIYDMRKNVLFENTDVSVKIIDASEDLDAFLADAKEMVKVKSYTPSTGYSGYQGYSGYGGSGYQYNKPNSSPYNPLPASTKTASEDKKDDKKDKGKGKSDKKDKPRTKIGAGWAGANAAQQESMFGDDYDDPDYPYGGYSDKYYLGGK